ncbi:MAG: diaminopimelate epimerase [Streptosporangiales bacterium]|nr:diaminopimelate epimerase [Streptosporangiales bacterium]
MRFAKGHGTENDFVILPDPDGALEPTPGLVAALCDRRAGIGADGVLRVVRTKAVPEVAGQAGEAEWFMDYRNADGSLAEMCGNGVRVFARYLVREGFVAPGEHRFATRGGPRVVTVPGDGDVTADMGRPEVYGPGMAEFGGRTFPGLRVSLGNPHLACLVDEPLEAFDLSAPPLLDPAEFPDGGNVELVHAAGDAVAMRVHERGSGETRSCGTGAVAAAVAAAATAGRATGEWAVTVPGGRLTVTLTGRTSLLTGPAVIVADGEIDPAYLAALR